MGTMALRNSARKSEPSVPQTRRSTRATPATTVVTPSPRRSQGERRADAESRLLIAAKTLLARKGWVGMTLADVGDAAGYSRGLAAHHFGNKAGLLRALTQHINTSFMDAMRAAPPREPGLDSILGYISVYLGRTDPNWTNTRTLLLLLAEASLEDSETGTLLAQYNRTMFAYLEQNIRAGVRKGEIQRGTSPEIGAEFIVGALRGMMLQRLLEGRAVDTRQLQKQLLALIKRALAARPRTTATGAK